LTHPYLARAWAKREADLRVEAPGQSQKIAIMGALDFVSRQLTVATSQTKRSADFIAMLERLDQIHGPKPGAACKPVIIALDNRPIHTSKATRAALAARKHWLTPEWLAKYAPELNDIERDWKTIKARHISPTRLSKTVTAFKQRSKRKLPTLSAAPVQTGAHRSRAPTSSAAFGWRASHRPIFWTKSMRI
jgi:transposase